MKKLIVMGSIVLSALMLLNGCEKNGASVSDNAISGDEAYAEENKNSIDFEDGKCGFVGFEYSIMGGASAPNLSVVDYNGSKALKAESSGKSICVAFHVNDLLGDKAKDVKKVCMDISVGNSSGEFEAAIGNIYAVYPEGHEMMTWEIVKEEDNHMTVETEVNTDMVFGENSFIGVSIEVDNAYFNGKGHSDLYIDNINFLDGSGNIIVADTSKIFAPITTESDRSNMYRIMDEVEFPDFYCTGEEWTQNGYEMTSDFLDALVPGSVIEIEYTSESGDLWIVFPMSDNGWVRVGQYDDYINDSKSVVQIKYEQIAALLGDNKADWGKILQCESDSPWKVYSVKVATIDSSPVFIEGTEFAGYSCSADAGISNGIEMPEEIVSALVPGCVIRIEYESTDDSMWITVSGNNAAEGTEYDCGMETDVCEDGYCYVTYEEIQEVCGNKPSKWGAKLMCKSSGDWSVSSLNIGAYEVPMPRVRGAVDFEFACSDHWESGNGFEMDEDFFDAIVPGCVVRIAYASEDGTMSLVIPWAKNGWERCGWDEALYDGKYCYVTYDMIVSKCGEDKSKWGKMVQCWSTSDWEVFGISIGSTDDY